MDSYHIPTLGENRPSLRDAPEVSTLASLAGESTHSALSEIICELGAGDLTLRGEVPTFYLKQLAQETAARVPAVRQVHNELRVRSRPVTRR